MICICRFAPPDEAESSGDEAAGVSEEASQDSEAAASDKAAEDAESDDEAEDAASERDAEDTASQHDAEDQAQNGAEELTQRRAANVTAMLSDRHVTCHDSVHDSILQYSNRRSRCISASPVVRYEFEHGCDVRRLEVMRQPMVSGLAVSADLKLFKPFKSPLGLGMGMSQVRHAVRKVHLRAQCAR